MISLVLFQEERKVLKIEDKPNFTVEDYKNPPEKDMKTDSSTGKPMYRSKKLPDGTVLRFAIMNKKGKQGGHSVMTSKWNPKG